MNTPIESLSALALSGVVEVKQRTEGRALAGQKIETCLGNGSAGMREKVENGQAANNLAAIK